MMLTEYIRALLVHALTMATQGHTPAEIEAGVKQRGAELRKDFPAHVLSE